MSSRKMIKLTKSFQPRFVLRSVRSMFLLLLPSFLGASPVSSASPTASSDPTSPVLSTPSSHPEPDIPLFQQSGYPEYDDDDYYPPDDPDDLQIPHEDNGNWPYPPDDGGVPQYREPDPEPRDLIEGEDVFGAASWGEIVKTMMLVLLSFALIAAGFVAYRVMGRAHNRTLIEADVDQPLIAGNVRN
jgi:hypothetical protein